MKAILRVILLLSKFGRHSAILLLAVGYAYSSFFSSVKCSYTRSRSQRSPICTKRHLLQWWYTFSELVLKNSKGLQHIYMAWTRNFTKMDLILMKVFTFTDHSNSAVEAVSAQGTPNDGLLPGYYNGVQWPIRGRSASVPFSGFSWGTWKGRDFTCWSIIMKGEGNLSFRSVKWLKRANRYILWLRKRRGFARLTAVERDAKF